MDVSKFKDDEIEQNDLEIGNSENVLNNLENEFIQILTEIEGNPATSHYVKDYQKLFENFKENYKIRKVLADKCAELEKQVAEKKQELLMSAGEIENEDFVNKSSLEKNDDNNDEKEEEGTIELVEQLSDNNVENEDVAVKSN
ncbi:hypothetical protein FQR65_LT09834 [Abscondita terminalis]|nr:hypothetical protein FQR65_LT09834 [Abscondita terminalis]